MDGEACPVRPGARARKRGSSSNRSVNDGGDDMATTMNGTIKRLVSDKGFGFIAAGDGNEYFFHQSACTQTAFDELREGQAVTFEKGQGPKGPRGENVRLA
jgi:CspA family cold shock protein